MCSPADRTPTTGARSVISAAHLNAAEGNENEVGNPSSAESVSELPDTSVIAAWHHDASRAGASTTGPPGMSLPWLTRPRP